MSNVSGLSTTAATFECWMKMSTAAGVASRPQTLIRQGIGAPEFTYAGDDKLSVTWLGKSATRPTPGRCPTARGTTSRWCSTTAT